MYLRGEVCPTSPLDADPSPLWRQTPLDADPLDTDPSPRMQTPHPRGRPSTLDADPPGGRPPGHVTCDACLEATPPHPPTIDRVTDACENITLPQTSFAGGKKKPTGLSVRLLTMVKFEISL